MAGARQLLRGRQAGRTGTDDGHFLARAESRRLRRDPAVLPAHVDDFMLDRLDADRIFMDTQGAGRFARRRADAARKFGEVIRRMQDVERFAVVTAVHQVIPVRNDVIHGTARGAEGNAAIHAARALHGRLRIRQVQHEFLVVLQARGRLQIVFVLALEFHEAGNFTHDSSFVFGWRGAAGPLPGHSFGNELGWLRRRRLGLPWRRQRPFQSAHACIRSGRLSRTCRAPQPSRRARRGRGCCPCA